MTDSVTALLQAPDLSLDGISLTWEKTQVWLATVGLRILVTIVLAAISLLAAPPADRPGRRHDDLEVRPAPGRVRAGRARPRQRRRVRQRAAAPAGRDGRVAAAQHRHLRRRHARGPDDHGDLLGIPLAPLLASAGVGGVALGFGAQSLVKDFLSGIFMILEDQYGVGDVIDTGEAIGTVEEVTLRVTRLRDANGVIWYVRNGEIIRIGNRVAGLVDGDRRHAGVLLREHRARRRGHPRGRQRRWTSDPEWADKLARGAEGASGSSRSPGRRDDPHRRQVRAGRAVPRLARDPRAASRRRSTPPASRRRSCSAPSARPVAPGSAGIEPLRRRSAAHETSRPWCTRSTRASRTTRRCGRSTPRHDLGPAEDRLRMFLEQYCGGPTTYSEQRGHPRLRMRHAPVHGDPGHARPLAAAHAWPRVDTLDLPRGRPAAARLPRARRAHAGQQLDDSDRRPPRCDPPPREPTGATRGRERVSSTGRHASAWCRVTQLTTTSDATA